jgi:hypothetical protein
MFRKLTLAIIALASLAAATPASAHGFHFGGGRGFHGGFHGGWHHHFHRGFGFYRAGYYAGGDSCYRIVYTDFGPRRVYVCD